MHRVLILTVLIGSVSCTEESVREDDRNALGEPTLEDLFAGRARFQSVSEAQPVNVALPPDQRRMSIFTAPDGSMFTFVRLGPYPPSGTFQIVRLSSSDGINFAQDGEALFPAFRSWQLYDPHLAFDAATGRYWISMECQNPGEAHPVASLCISTSTTPLDNGSWSQPRELVRGGAKSASTGVLLVSGSSHYFAWASLYQGPNAWVEGVENTLTNAMLVPEPFALQGTADQVGTRLTFGEVGNAFCTNGWDCNNQNITDWLELDGRYYAIENGGNYYQCARWNDFGTSEWHIGIRRSTSPLGDYSETTGPVLSGLRGDWCALSYPTIAVLDGVTYLYFAHTTADGDANLEHYPTPHGGTWAQVLQARSKLIWSTDVPRQTLCSALLPSLAADPTVDNKLRAATCITLGRDASQLELDTWRPSVTSHALTSTDLYWALATSAEFGQRWNLAGLDDTAKIWLVFNLFLRRVPSSGDLDTFKTMLHDGQIKNDAELMAVILRSPEFAFRFPAFQF